MPDYGPADDAIRATGAAIRYGGDKAYYSRAHDYIGIPHPTAFMGQPEWYATHFHELSHWAERRVEWAGSYALGELVAEITSCYLSAELDIPQGGVLTNHEAYLASWLRELEGDHRAIFRAAAQASRTSDFLLGFSRPTDATVASRTVAVA